MSNIINPVITTTAQTVECVAAYLILKGFIIRLKNKNKKTEPIKIELNIAAVSLFFKVVVFFNNEMTSCKTVNASIINADVHPIFLFKAKNIPANIDTSGIRKSK